MIEIDRNRVRWFFLGLLRDGACIHLYENHSENSLTGDISNATTVNPSLFSLVNTFKKIAHLVSNIFVCIFMFTPMLFLLPCLQSTNVVSHVCVGEREGGLQDSFVFTAEIPALFKN